MRRYLIIALVLIGAYFSYNFIVEYLEIQQFLNQVPKVLKIEGSVGGASVAVDIDEDTSWILIVKAVATILSTFLGIKLINKYVK